MVLLYDRLDLLLVSTWILLSVLTINDACMFQRIGAAGVFLGILAAAIRSHFFEEKISSVIDEKNLAMAGSAKAYLELQKTINELLTDAPSEHLQTQVVKEQMRIACLKTQELIDCVVSFEKKDRDSLQRQKVSAFKIEILSIGLATLQWGFGDMAINAINGRGFVGC